MKRDSFRYGLRALSLLFLLAMPAIAQSAGWQWMAPERVYTLVKQGSGLWLIDVRSEAAFADGHVEGAVHIPAGVLAKKHLPKGKVFIVVDDSLGLRNGRDAADILQQDRQEKVYLLEGGFLAWQGEGYPVAGTGSGRAVRGVTFDELVWAQENRIALRIFDLRDKDERAKSPVPQAQETEGANVVERLGKVKAALTLTKKMGLAAKLENPVTTILVFPLAADPRQVLERSMSGFPGDIRYLEGGYAAWAAKADKRTNTHGACPTCPGGAGGGDKK